MLVHSLDKDNYYLHGDKYIKYFEDFFKNHPWKENETISLYFDFPYCESNCRYCMLNSDNFYSSKKLIPVYEEKIIEQLESFQHLLSIKPIKVVTFGGGSPPLMSKDTIKKIISLIPDWDKITMRKFEVHPRSLTLDYVKFLVDVMHINRLTIGIQSFDKTANINQRRIPCNINTLEDCIIELKKNNVFVNIDLVALFDYDNDIEKGWIDFKNDLHILDEIIKPHSFYIQVNYATEDHFYENLYKMRCIVKEFLENSSGAYSPWDEKMLSTNKIDVLRNLDHVHYFVTEEQRRFSIDNGTYRDNFDDINYIGFGGVQNHQVFTTLTNNSIIYGYYNFSEKRWIHNISTNMVEDSDYIPEKFTSIQDVQCGPWTLKASETALSWLNEKE